MVNELTIAEIAEKENIDRSTVLKRIQRNLYPNARRVKSPVGEYWVIPDSDLINVSPDSLKPGPKAKVKKK